MREKCGRRRRGRGVVAVVVAAVMVVGAVVMSTAVRLVEGQTEPARMAGANGYGGASFAGSAGHALLFSKTYAVKRDFKDFPTTALTFEAWVQTNDFCHPGTFASYAVESDSEDEEDRDRAYNSFVIFDPINVLACRDFQFLQLRPDEYTGEPDYHRGCSTFFDSENGVDADVSVVSRSARWHHIAVTWDANNNGTVSIFKDGLRVITAPTARTTPLKPVRACVYFSDEYFPSARVRESLHRFFLFFNVSLFVTVLSYCFEKHPHCPADMQ